MNEHEVNAEVRTVRTVATSIAAVLISIVMGITGYNIANGQAVNDRIEACVKAGGTWDDTRVGGVLCELTK